MDNEKGKIKVQIYEHEFGMREDGEEWFDDIWQAKAFVADFNNSPESLGADGQYWHAAIVGV